ncbi:MAG: hypothetical protein M1826_002190 [Phylliscum demangeonii]|nr:MAG: hypothetical protein M1826_002190 [Phylliscum demangeonii]
MTHPGERAVHHPDQDPTASDAPPSDPSHSPADYGRTSTWVDRAGQPDLYTMSFNEGTPAWERHDALDDLGAPVRDSVHPRSGAENIPSVGAWNDSPTAGVAIEAQASTRAPAEEETSLVHTALPAHHPPCLGRGRAAIVEPTAPPLVHGVLRRAWTIRFDASLLCCTVGDCAPDAGFDTLRDDSPDRYPGRDLRETGDGERSRYCSPPGGP